MRSRKGLADIPVPIPARSLRGETLRIRSQLRVVSAADTKRPEMVVASPSGIFYVQMDNIQKFVYYGPICEKYTQKRTYHNGYVRFVHTGSREPELYSS